MASEIITKSEFYDLLKKQIKIKRGSVSSNKRKTKSNLRKNYIS